MYLEEVTGKIQRLFFAVSGDGQKFGQKKPLPFRLGQNRLHSLRFSEVNKKSLAAFVLASGGEDYLCQATCQTPSKWTAAKDIAGIGEPGVLTDHGAGRRLLFFGSQNINFAIATAGGKWKIFSKPLLTPRPDYFDNQSLQIGQARTTAQGILLTYYCYYQDNDKQTLSLGAAMADKHNPEKILWRTDFPLWQQTDEYENKKLTVVGETDFAGKPLLFLQDEFGKLYCVELPLWNLSAQTKTHTRKPRLERSHKNPVLSPIPHHDWESKAAFNPAAFVAKGRVHLIYRAIGNDDISSFGYASSRDGIHFDERLDYPIYSPRQDFEGRGLKQSARQSPFASGGTGIGGCEDPRVSLIDDVLYMTYVAFDGWHPPRVALSTITLSDFLNHRWNWKQPVLISPYLPGDGNKNSCILPEKINGQYVVFHRIWPDILMDYVKTLNFDGHHNFLSKKGHAKISPRKSHWDSRKVGIGATPIKTPEGWLLIYQAVGHQEPGKYKIGAMLLDLQNPSKILARSNSPVLEPEAWYENEGWKYGVVYPCGAAVVGDDLMVYYGGADTYTCVAKANLTEFLTHLLTHKTATLQSVSL